jgi:hypothetical protein
MSKPLILSEKQWLDIYNIIAKIHPHSVLLIRDKMKETLGFTVRRHREWIPEQGYDGHGNYVETIRLDFFNEPKRTMFLLRYSDIIGKTSLDR